MEEQKKQPMLMKSRAKALQPESSKEEQELATRMKRIYTALEDNFLSFESTVEKVLDTFTSITEFQINMITQNTPELGRVIATGYSAIQMQFQSVANLMSDDGTAFLCSPKELSDGIYFRLNEMNILENRRLAVDVVEHLRTKDIPMIMSLIYLTDVTRICTLTTNEMKKYKVVPYKSVYPTDKFFNQMKAVLDEARELLESVYGEILDESVNPKEEKLINTRFSLSGGESIPPRGLTNPIILE